MPTSRTTKCYRFSVLFYTIVYCASGIALTAVLSFVLLRRYSVGYFFGQTRTSIFFLYASAILIFISTFVSWKGVVKRNAIILRCFSVLLAITIILELSGAAWCFVSRANLRASTTIIFQNKFQQALYDPSLQYYWDSIQGEMECCGVHGPGDYRNVKTIPFSCCGSSADIRQSSCHYIYQKGCLDIFTMLVSKDFLLISIVVTILAILQLPGVFLSWSLAKRIVREAI